MIKATEVKVIWSESHLFTDEAIYSLDKFEHLAALAAASHVGGGYLKTKVEIMFDNGDVYGCRLDLGCGGNDKGALHHMKAVLNYYKENQDQPGYHDVKSTIEFLERVDFSNENFDNYRLVDAAEQAYQEEKEAEKLRKQEAYKAKQEQEKADREKFRALFENEIEIPEDAKAVIVATVTSYDAEGSDPYGDYYRYNTDRTIILAWSKHTRDLFSEMRKAAKNHPLTAHLADKENSTEHREKYSMGRGFYLTEKDYRSCGLSVRKITFYSEDKLRQIPTGEIAIPGYKPATSTEQANGYDTKPVQTMNHTKTGDLIFVVQLVDRTSKEEFQAVRSIAKQHGGHYSRFSKEGAIPGFHFDSEESALAFTQAIAPEQPEQAPEQPEPQPKAEQPADKPSFKANKCGDVWTVTVSQGERSQTFEDIQAANMLQACRIAWALFTAPTPPTDPEGTRTTTAPSECEPVASVDSGHPCPPSQPDNVIPMFKKPSDPVDGFRKQAQLVRELADMASSITRTTPEQPDKKEVIAAGHMERLAHMVAFDDVHQEGDQVVLKYDGYVYRFTIPGLPPLPSMNGERLH